MFNLSQQLRSVGTSLGDRLRGLIPAKTEYIFPENDPFEDQIKEMQGKGRTIDQVNRAIDMHPDIQDREKTKQKANDIYGIGSSLSSIKRQDSKLGEGIVKAGRQASTAINSAFAIPGAFAQEKAEKTPLAPIAPLIGLATDLITPGPGEFKGFSDITTTILNKLKGKSVTSKQEILDLTNMGEVRQAEKDLIRRILDEDYRGEPLAKEASKYKSAEEFVKAVKDADTGGIGAGRPYVPALRQVKMKNEVSLGEIAGLPDKEITVYRGVDNAKQKDIAIGDYVAGTKELAGTYTGDASKIISKKIKLKDIYVGKDEMTKEELIQMLKNPEKFHIEALYKPNAVDESQLTDFYNQATKSKVPVQEFANKVKTELLPLKVKGSDKYKITGTTYHDANAMLEEGNFTPKYENTSLPSELRGKVENYSENIYESPISTSGGDVHFKYESKNYFAHVRSEEMASSYMPGKKVLRDIEWQSDLFQKGRLEGENQDAIGMMAKLRETEKSAGHKLSKAEADKIAQGIKGERTAELSKLEPYRNTWHERIGRERVKYAAQNGYDTLLVPTGETAMKIEGLGETAQWKTIIDNLEVDLANPSRRVLSEQPLKAGREVFRNGEDTSWIITDVLGDGKFKAVPKKTWEDIRPDKFKVDSIDQHNLSMAEESFDISGKIDEDYMRQRIKDAVEQYGVGSEEAREAQGQYEVFRFYNKEVRKFLSNKFSGKEIVDPQGVKWIEVDVPKGLGKDPVQAFGATTVGTTAAIGGGILAGAAAPLINERLNSNK